MSHDKNLIEIPIFHHIRNSFVLRWNIGYKVALVNSKDISLDKFWILSPNLLHVNLKIYSFLKSSIFT